AGIGWVTSQGPGRGREAREFSMTPGPIPPVAREDVFPEPNLRFGRLPQYSRVGLAAVAFALRDAGMEHWETKRTAGIVASTRTGCLSTDIEYYNTVLPEGGGLPSPNLFSCTLPTCFLGEAAIQFGLTGSTFIVNDAAGDSLCGLRTALESLSWGDGDTVLAGHIDLPSRRALPGIAPAVPGALFMVLKDARVEPASGYGTLDRSDQGAVRRNGIAMADLTELVRACLEGLRR
ncbi:MAG: beta-ketoacyl synthase N-terminal-like domain-containing protein, partial [Candidatus Deferrimicrobiaceae bacterium]